LPASFMTLSSCDLWRQDIVNSCQVNQLYLFDNRKNDIFNIEHTWICNILVQPNTPYLNTEYLIDADNNNEISLTVDIREYTFADNGDQVTTWPMLYNQTVKNIFNKVRALASPLMRENAAHKKEDYPYIGYVLQGVKDRPTVNSTPLDKGNVTEVKAPGYILFETTAEASKYCEFMYSKLYNLLISVTKCISKTQPQSIVQIGNFNFTNVDVTDPIALYSFFGLNEEEIEYIESNVN